MTTGDDVRELTEDTGTDGPAPVRTGRLRLTRPAASDFDELFELHSDPQVWKHYPSLRHRRPEQTQAMMTSAQQAWDTDGLGSWVARDLDGGALVGMGGCTIRHGTVWNLYYRLVRERWGHGFTQEIIAAARSAAAQRRPDLPVTAYLVEHNTSSRRAAERAGLDLVWRGFDRGNPDPAARRLIFADRALDEITLQSVIDAK